MGLTNILNLHCAGAEMGHNFTSGLLPDSHNGLSDPKTYTVMECPLRGKWIGGNSHMFTAHAQKLA
jgi:hypothetical protein